MRHFFSYMLLAMAFVAMSAKAEGTDPDVNFIAYMSYADHWIKDSGNVPECGFYTFSRDKEGFNALTHDKWEVIARNSGTVAKGKAYAFYTAESWITPDPQLYIYNAETWTLDHKISYGKNENYAMADMTYDYANNRLLAVAYSAKRQAGNGKLFQIDESNGELTELLTLNHLFIGVAADADGMLWALSEDGSLYRLSATGRTLNVGHTGYIPQQEEEVNSLCIDHRTGRLYWVASYCVPEMPSQFLRGLFEIDKTTGKATLIRPFVYGEKLTALSIPCPSSLDAPDDLFDLRLEPQTGGSAKADILFTAPAVSYRQKALAASALKVHIWMDGVALEDAEVMPGAAFQHAVELTERKTHVVTVQLEDAEGRLGQKFTAERYIGFDTPSAVQNIHFTYDPDRQDITLTWSAVERGINNGDIDTKNLRYLVTRYSPGEKEDVAADLSECTFTEHITRPMAYTRYGVIAYDTEAEGKVAYSQYEVVGEPQELPFVCGLNSWGDFNQFITIDANGDGYGDWGTPSWWYDEGYGAAFCYLTKGETQDDWLITPALAFKPGHAYQIIFQTYGYYGYQNHLQVSVGHRAEVESLTRLLADMVYNVPMPESFPYDSEDVETGSVVFTAQEGDHYIGFHNINEKAPGAYYTDHMSIDNIYIRDLEGTSVQQVSLRPASKSSYRYDLQGRTPARHTGAHGIILTPSGKTLR